MIKLYENGVYLLNGTEIVEDNGSAQLPISKEEAVKNTMAYGILNAHNTSGNMENESGISCSRSSIIFIKP